MRSLLVIRFAKMLYLYAVFLFLALRKPSCRRVGQCISKRAKALSTFEVFFRNCFLKTKLSIESIRFLRYTLNEPAI